MNGSTDVSLRDLMIEHAQTVDPSRFSREQFELFSIPAFDRGEPDVVRGEGIGSAKQLVRSGDVLLSKIVPHIRRAWIVRNGSRKRLLASSEWMVFRSSAFEPEYMRQLLLSDRFHAHLMGTVAGVGGSLLRARPALVGKIEVSLPRLTEQRRVARMLDAADALRSQRRATFRLLRELHGTNLASIVAAHGSEHRRLGDLAKVQGGLQVTRARASRPRQVPYLRVANVHRGRLDLTEVKPLGVTDAEAQRCALRINDLLVVEGHGNPAEIGRVARWDASIPECVHQNHLIRVRCEKDLLLPEFAEAYVNSGLGRLHLMRAGKTTSGLNTITVNDVRSVPIVVPRMELQLRFARTVAAIEEAERRATLHMEGVDVLFSSLQHRAFADAI